MEEMRNGNISTKCEFKYKYGDEQIFEKGENKLGNMTIASFDTTIDVKQYSLDYSISPQIYIDPNFRSIQNIVSSNHESELKTGFAMWDYCLYEQFGFGMDKIGFSSYE